MQLAAKVWLKMSTEILLYLELLQAKIQQKKIDRKLKLNNKITYQLPTI